MPSDTLDQIRMRAYELWEEQGRPDGLSDVHWQQAARELGAGPFDLERDPGISRSGGETPQRLAGVADSGTQPESDAVSTAGGETPERLAGIATTESDVMSDTTPSGGIDPNQRGRTNK